MFFKHAQLDLALRTETTEEARKNWMEINPTIHYNGIED